MSQNHIIKQQIADILFSDKEKSSDLFDEISRLFNNRIRDITYEVFNRLVPEQKLIQLESLVLDLGSLSYPISQEELSMKYKDALEKALLIKIEELEAFDKIEGVESKNHVISVSNSAFLEHFLITGVIPWWSRENDETSNPEFVFSTILTENKAGLKKLLSGIVTRSNVRKRLVYSFSEKVVKEVIRLFEPSEASFIIEYHKETSVFQQKSSVVKTEQSDFEKSLWLFILNYMFGDFSSQFGRKMFVKTTIVSLAKHYNLSYIHLLSLFIEAIQTNRDRYLNVKELPAILIELSDELSFDQNSYLASPESREIENENSRDSLNEKVEVVILFLLTGSYPDKNGIVDKAKLEKLTLFLLDKAPTLISGFLLKFGKEEAVRNRLVENFGELTVLRILKVLRPLDFEILSNYIHVTTEVQRKRNIVKVEETEFRKFLLKFIFEYIFIDKSSYFSIRTFVQQIIKKQANHYNLSYGVFLSIFIKSLTLERAILENNNELYYTLMSLLNDFNIENKERIVGEPNEKINELQVNSKIDEIKQLGENGIKQSTIDYHSRAEERKYFLRNVLFFLLQHNYFPWWYKESSERDASALLREYFTEYPAESVLLLEHAIANRLLSMSFISENSDFIFKVIETVKGGKEALSVVNLLIKLNSHIDDRVLSDKLRVFIVLSLIETFDQNQFSSFNSDLFVAEYLSKYADFSGKTRKELVQELLIPLGSIGASSFQSQVKKHLEGALEFKDLIKQPYRVNVEFSIENFKKLLFKQEIDFNYSIFEAKIYDILEYYLLNNRLPPGIEEILADNLRSFLFVMFIELYKISQSSLNRLFARTSFSVDARMFVHDIFVNQHTEEANEIRSILLNYFVDDVLQLAKKNGVLDFKDNIKLDDLFSTISILLLEKGQKREFVLRLFQSPSFNQQASRIYNMESYFRIISSLSNETSLVIVKRMIYVINLIAIDSFEREILNRFFREFTFLWLSNSSNGLSDGEFIKAFLNYLSDKKGYSMLQMYKQIDAVSQRQNLFIHEDTRLFFDSFCSQSRHFIEKNRYKESLKIQFESFEEKVLKDNGFAIEDTVHLLEVDSDVIKKREIEKREVEKLLKGEQIYIHNAGLILLHPFLSTYFQKTECIVDGQFINLEKKLRAPYLLQFLVTGQENQSEQNMLLNKILSGIETETALQKISALTEMEKSISEDLLKAVMNQWDKMKNSSIEGFRGSFLMRDGSLNLTDDAWVLKIEQRGYDVLLQSLPWTLSMIKASWMDKPLLVEWT